MVHLNRCSGAPHNTNFKFFFKTHKIHKILKDGAERPRLSRAVMDRRSRPGPEPTTLEAVGNQWRYALVVVQAGEEEEVIIRITTVTQSGSVNKYVLSCWQNAECELIDNFIHRKETIEHNTNQIKLNNK